MLQAKGDRSFRFLRDKAAGFGYESTLSTWQQWGDLSFGRKLLPDPETIRAFARGLGVSETEVLMAAARQVGLDVGEGNTTDLVLPGAGGLPPADRSVIASLASVLVAKEEARQG